MYYVGLDLGQAQDPAAIAVVERVDASVLLVRYLERVALGTPYPAVRITSGDREHQAGQVSYVPKQDLMAGVETMLERGERKIAHRVREAGSLVRELMDVKMTWAGRSGKARVGADGSGEHDDLVIAVALACWRAKRRQNGFGAGRLPGM